MLGTGLPFAMVVVDKGNSTDGAITYTVRLFETPPMARIDILKRIIGVEKYVRNNELPTVNPITSSARSTNTTISLNPNFKRHL